MTGFFQKLANIVICMPVFLLITLSAVTGCSLAGKNANSRFIEQGTAFHHLVLGKVNHRVEQTPLRIYIEGDGKAFINNKNIALDPTPRYAPVLGLWKMDPGDAVYVGRPCYMGTANLPECNQRVWTSERYGDLVVESMLAVVERYSNNQPLVLIGHSGGGALAMLIASRINTQYRSGDANRGVNIAAVVTLSGNLDVASWTEYHGYSPLNQSGNPADKLPLAEHILQLHVVAGRDREIPPYLTYNLRSRLPADSICEVPGYDHDCCWNYRWVKFLIELDNHLLSGQASLGGVCAVFSS